MTVIRDGLFLNELTYCTTIKNTTQTNLDDHFSNYVSTKTVCKLINMFDQGLAVY